MYNIYPKQFADKIMKYLNWKQTQHSQENLMVQDIKGALMLHNEGVPKQFVKNILDD